MMRKFNSMPRVESRFDPEGGGYDYSTAMSSGGASPVSQATEAGQKVTDLSYSKAVPASKEDIKKHGLSDDAELILVGSKSKKFKDLIEEGAHVVNKGGRYFITEKPKEKRPLLGDDGSVSGSVLDVLLKRDS